MKKNLFAPEFNALPDVIPIFPLENVLLLPCGHLPLTVFETHFLAMMDEALSSHRLIGMVQPKSGNLKESAEKGAVFDIGCAGKITEFSEDTDGAYTVKLTGICRFKIKEEIPVSGGYRRVRPSWEEYRADLETKNCLGLDREKLKELLHKYFQKEGMDCNWQAVDDAPDGKLITCLSMVCPFTACEKQALLEAQCCETRSKMFMSMLEIAACSEDCKSQH